MQRYSIRLGVDIGGTFTDVVLETEERRYIAKVLTTYAAPENAILEGIGKVCDSAGIAPGDIQQIIHGTTLATNALIERRGAKTALITTKGFRDVIEMRTESRFEQYDLNLTLPAPLLPRQMRYTVTERVDARGNVLVPLDPDEVEQLVDRIAAAGYESVAVGLIHSYVNGAHERAIHEIIARKLPDVMVSLSSEVSPQMREYERFNTVTANAYIKPLMKSYLDRLEERLRGIGIGCDVFMMHSGGGIISLESAADFPVRLVESGPAGGAIFSADVAARYGLDRVVSFDMGGTTAKICLIRDQTPKSSRVFEVARTYRFKKGSGMPITIPVIDMVEIGAGGGSLAHVDSMRQIRVGPESAGSEPGPACFGRGGEKPAVTDADLLLGRLAPDSFAGGSIVLDTGRSETALHDGIGADLDIDSTTAAHGLSEVVDENMANAARMHAVENGEALSDYTMIAFGGAAPLHAGRLCQKLDVNRLLVPPGAGAGSAIGFLRAPFSFEANRSLFMTLDDFRADRAAALLDELHAEAAEFVRRCDPFQTIQSEYRIYMRYSGQGWEIPIEIEDTQARAPDPQILRRLFLEEYTKLFGRDVDGMDIEITVWAVKATTPRPDIAPTRPAKVGAEVAIQRTRRLFDPARDGFVDANLVARESLVEGDVVAGPALIVEAETTIVVPSDFKAIRQPDGCIDISKQN